VKRAGSVFLLVVAALLAAMVWFSAATQPFNVQLERERPHHVYDFFSYYRPNAEYAFTRLRHGLPPELTDLRPSREIKVPIAHLAPDAGAAAGLRMAGVRAVALAATLAGLLARSLGASTLGSVTAGLLYATSLPLWSSVWTPPMLYTSAWVPGLLLAVENAVERPGARRATALALVLAAMILAGWPHALVMAALAATITGTASLLLAARRTRRLPIAALLTIARRRRGRPAMAPSFASVELLRQSTRAPGAIDASSAGREGAIHEPGTFFDDLVRDGLSNGVPGLASPVLAVLAVVLTGYGRARAAVMLAVAALALAISFPNHTPFFDWLRHIPLVGEFRFPFRYRLLSMLALAVCAGLGISRIEVRGGRRGVVRDQYRRDAGAARGAMLLRSTQARTFPHEQVRSIGASRRSPPRRVLAAAPHRAATGEQRIAQLLARLRHRQDRPAQGTAGRARPRAALARDDRPHDELLRGWRRRRRGRGAGARRGPANGAPRAVLWPHEASGRRVARSAARSDVGALPDRRVAAAVARHALPARLRSARSALPL
jgi:hypothetical protein